MNPQENNSEPNTPNNPSQQPNVSQQPAWDATKPASSPAATPGQSMPATGGMPASLPPYSPPANSAPTGPVVMNNGSKKKRVILVSAIAGGIVLLGGATAAAYYGYVLPNKPQNILNAALVNEFTPGKITSTTFHGNYSAKQTGDDMTMAGSFKGSVDKNGPFDISGDFDAVVTKITLDMRSADGKDFYLRVGGLEGLGPLLEDDGDSDASTMLTTYAPLVEAVNNQWFIINQSLISQLQPDADVSKGLKLSDEDSKKLADAYKKHQFLTVQEKLKDEKIGSRDSHHLKLVIDKAKLKSFAAEIKAAKLSSIKMTNDQLADFNKEADKANFSKYPIEVWISKSEKFIDQIKFATNDKDGQFTATATVDDWNKPVKVEKPAGAKSLLELLGQMNNAGGLSGTETEALFGTEEDAPATGISL
jgi:hypothetical protein